MIFSSSGPNRRRNPFSSNGLSPESKRLLFGGRVLRYDPAVSADHPESTDRHEELTAEGDADMDVTGAGHIGGTGAIRPIQPSAASGVAATGAAGIQSPKDEIMISDAARSLSEMQMDPQVRAARLAEIKSAIDAGTYDTPQRLEAAIEKMIVAWRHA
jgi:anti-sigma28 factor (negative regulator of flagellin synthesis)